MDRIFPLFFQNNSSHAVGVYLNDDEDYVALYPDTLISDFEERLGIVENGKKERVAGGSATWESIFESSSVPSDTLSLFVFHVDTLAKYDWESIRKDYNILKRYDLSLEDLEQLNFTIIYPPDSSMEGVQMYPK